MDDPTIVELLGRFKNDIHKYSFEEQCSLILFSIQKISIDFDKEGPYVLTTTNFEKTAFTKNNNLSENSIKKISSLKQARDFLYLSFFYRTWL